MKRFFIFFMSVMLCVSVCGCAAILIGTGVAAGVAISEDTVKLEADTSFDRAFKVTRKVIDEMGAINLQDKDAGKMEANVQDSKISARVVPVTTKTVRIEIKSRKNLLPNVDLATTIINKINSRL